MLKDERNNKMSSPLGGSSVLKSALRDLIETRKKVLRGHFYVRGHRYLIPSRKFILFISSTFTDTQRERDILKDLILAELEDFIRQGGYNIQVSFSDMRWGVTDESTLDHRTWIECSREIERCREESAGMFFLSLQAEK